MKEKKETDDDPSVLRNPSLDFTRFIVEENFNDNKNNNIGEVNDIDQLTSTQHYPKPVDPNQHKNKKKKKIEKIKFKKIN
jgi:hypothetical protein